MNIQNVLVAVVLASLFFSGIYTTFVMVGAEYGETIDAADFMILGNTTSVEANLNKLNASSQEIVEINEQYNNLTLTEGGEYPVYKFLSFFAMMKNSLTTIDDMFKIIASVLGIPAFIVYTLMALLVLAFIMGVIYLFTGR